MRDLLIIRYYI